MPARGEKMIVYKAENVSAGGGDEAARVHRAFWREYHVAVRCAGAGTGADLAGDLNQYPSLRTVPLRRV